MPAIARSSGLMQDAAEILDEVLQHDWQQCATDGELDLVELAQLSTARQRQLLSAWMKGNDLYRPSFDMVQRLQRGEVMLQGWVLKSGQCPGDHCAQGFW